MRYVFALILCLALTARLFAGDTGKAITVVPTTTTAQGGQRWALIVGINDYTSMPRLRFARQDAKALAKALELAGFERSKMVLMTDDTTDRSLYPTRGNLRHRINQIAQVVGPNDVLVIFFSGHGAEKSGQGYLIPVDGNPTDRGSLVPLSWVRQTLNTCTAKHRLLILDACHSGAKASDASTSAAGAMLSQLAGAAFATLSSCDVDQLSYENQEVGLGVFTNYVVEGLAGAADQTVQGNCDGTVTAMELWAFAASHTKQWSLQSGKTQTPKLTGNFTGQIELTRFQTSAELAQFQASRKRAAQHQAMQRPLKKMLRDLTLLGKQTEDVIDKVVLKQMQQKLEQTGQVPPWLARVLRTGLEKQTKTRNQFALRALIAFGENTTQKTPVSQSKIRLGRHANAVTAMAISPNRALLASGDKQGKIILWSTRNHRKLVRLSCPWQIDHLVFNPKNNQLLAANKDGNIAVFDLIAKQPALSKNLWQSHGKTLLACGFASTEKGSALVTVGHDGQHLEVTRWNTHTFKRQDTRTLLVKINPQNNASAGALSKNASWCAVGFSQGNIELWNLNDPKQTHHLTGPAQQVKDIAFDRETKAVVASFGESLYRWRFRPQMNGRENYGRRGFAVNRLHLTGTEGSALVLSSQGNVRQCDLGSNHKKTTTAYFPNNTTTLLVDDDMGRVFAGTQKGTVLQYRW